LGLASLQLIRSPRLMSIGNTTLAGSLSTSIASIRISSRGGLATCQDTGLQRCNASCAMGKSIENGQWVRFTLPDHLGRSLRKRTLTHCRNFEAICLDW
jgi:hypothetical protein